MYKYLQIVILKNHYLIFFEYHNLRSFQALQEMFFHILHICIKYANAMLDDFRLRIFKTLAEEGSFTRTAARLEISQPAVSQNIAEL